MEPKFGDRLKEIRLARNMSQEELASLLGTSKQVISRYEKNQRTPKITVANEYASKLNLSLNELLGENSLDQNGNPPALTEKDERDISRRLDQTLKDLEDAQGGLMFDGEPLDDVTKELLIASLRKDLEMGKRIAKQKYTPKKYRKPEGE